MHKYAILYSRTLFSGKQYSPFTKVTGVRYPVGITILVPIYYNIIPSFHGQHVDDDDGCLGDFIELL